MADSVNWGILQPLSAAQGAIHTSAPQTEAARLPNSPGLPESGGGGNPNRDIDIARLKMDQARQPGLLQEQQLSNQHLGLLNQGQTSINTQEAIKAQTLQQEQVFHQADLQALQKGGTDSYLKSLSAHDPSAAEAFSQAQQNTIKLKQDNGLTGVTNTANLWHTISDGYNPNDPQSQAKIMDNYNKNKVLLKRLDPNMPDLKTPSEVANYAGGAVHTAMGFIQQTKYQQEIQKSAAVEAMKPTALKKAQSDVADAQNALDQAKQSGDPKAIADAQTLLTQAQRGVQKELPSGLSNITNAVTGAVSNLFNGASNMLNSSNTANTNAVTPGSTPQTTNYTSSTTTASTFKPGTIATDADGNKATYIGGDPKDPKSWNEVKQ
jgi:hypothetical protein